VNNVTKDELVSFVKYEETHVLQAMSRKIVPFTIVAAGYCLKRTSDPSIQNRDQCPTKFFDKCDESKETIEKLFGECIEFKTELDMVMRHARQHRAKWTSLKAGVDSLMAKNENKVEASHLLNILLPFF
jgi:hypothetical protein